MNSKRKRDSFDTLTSKVFLILLGSILAMPSGYLLATANLQQQNSIMGAIFTILTIIGSLLIMISIFADDSFITKTAENTGSHEILIVVLLLALAISSLIKRVKKT